MANVTAASFAFWGSGEYDISNPDAARVLDDELPQAVKGVFRPERVPRHNKSLSAVIDWLESPDILGANGTVPVENLLEALLARREAGDTVTLVVLWPAEPADDEIAFVKEAHGAGIPIKNLCAGMDHLDLTPYEDKPEEVPVIEAVPVEEIAAKVAEVIGSDYVDMLLVAIRGIVTETVVDFLESRGIGAASQPVPGPVAVRVPEDKPPFDGGVPVSGVTKEYFLNADGRVRPAKGRPKTTTKEQRVSLTEAEVAGYVAAGAYDEK